VARAGTPLQGCPPGTEVAGGSKRKCYSLRREIYEIAVEYIFLSDAVFCVKIPINLTSLDLLVSNLKVMPILVMQQIFNVVLVYHGKKVII
jgi:hypothetical protein